MMIGAREVIHHLSSLSGDSVLLGSKETMARGSAVPTRRSEPRIDVHKVCSYELCESVDEEAVVIQQGEVFTVNRSAHGILVLMGHQPHVQQLIELHVPESRWRNSLNLYEVKWTKAVQVEAQGHLFLVGCQLTFGPSRYWNL